MGVGSPVGVLAAAVLGVESLAMIDCFSVVEGVSLVFGGGMGDWVNFFFSWVSSRFQSGFRWVMTFEFGGGMYWV